ncbi:hypothetical protein ACFWUP_17765 [Nocardia sp. NPDC058658]
MVDDQQERYLPVPSHSFWHKQPEAIRLVIDQMEVQAPHYARTAEEPAR